MEQGTLRVSIATAIEIKRWGDVRSIPQARLPRFKVFVQFFLNAELRSMALFANVRFAKKSNRVKKNTWLPVNERWANF